MFSRRCSLVALGISFSSIALLACSGSTNEPTGSGGAANAGGASPQSGGGNSSHSGGNGPASSGGYAYGVGGALPPTTGGSGSINVGGTAPTSGGTSTNRGGATSSVGGSGSGGVGGHSGGSSTAMGGNSGSPFVYPATPKAWQPSAACVDEATKRVAAMTLQQKAGQMVQGDSAVAKPADVVTYGLGSILSGGGSDPSGGDTANLWVNLVRGYLDQGQTLGTPILYGIDAVHGNNNVTGAVIFPHNIGLGCTRSPALVEEVGRITALETRGVGVNWTFAPVVAPALDERWGRTYETFAETPALAAELGVAATRGLQGASLAAKTSVLACAKHFAGDGATDAGKNEGNSTLPEAEFKRVALDPYQPAINAGVGSIMVSFSSYNGTKMSAHKALLTDTLKGTMGFRGFLVSDWAAVQKVPPVPTSSMTNRNPPPTAEALATAVNAGLDMIMEPFAHAAVRDLIAAAPAKSGSERIPEDRINDAATRILTIKCEMGMLATGYNSTVDSSLTSQIGSAEHRAVARRAVRESIVLLKNAGNVLPLPKTARVLLAGTAADNKAKQCGGWTIDWLGLGTKTPPVTGGDPAGDTPVTTIRSGIEAVVGAGNVTYATNGSTTATGMTHAVVVIGESPYAETSGDKSNLALSSVSPADVTALTNVAALGIPTVVVVISGRPIIITDQLSQAGAWLAAWLPGTEGDGVADVLFGDYKPTGKLSHSWPKAMTQIPINEGDADYTSDPPLFAYGFGLTY